MKKNKKLNKIVYTYGVFDLFHAGHAELLKEAKALGDILVVGVFADEVAASFKRKPIVQLSHRKKILENLRFVDKVVVQNELDPATNIQKLRPHILAKGPGAGWGRGRVPGEEAIKKIGGDIVKLKYHKGISTSDIIKKIKES